MTGVQEALLSILHTSPKMERESAFDVLLGRLLKHIAAMGVIEEVGPDQYMHKPLSNALINPVYRDAVPCWFVDTSWSLLICVNMIFGKASMFLDLLFWPFPSILPRLATKTLQILRQAPFNSATMSRIRCSTGFRSGPRWESSSTTTWPVTVLVERSGMILAVFR